MTNRYDRRAIMKDAHKRYRAGCRLGIGWTFAHCLQTAWQAARQRNDTRLRATRPIRDIIRLAA